MPGEEKAPADVTVIIPAWQAEYTIGRALDSVAGQTARPAAAIVVDDGSGDGTGDAARSHTARMNGVALTVIRQENAGAGAARNRALQEARTRYVAFLDADDEWLPGHLRESLRLLAESGCTLTLHNEWLVEGGEETLNDSVARLAERSDPFVAVYRKGCISTSTVVADREAVIAAGGFDPTLLNGQDVDLWLAVLGAPGATLGSSDEPLSRYFISPEGINAQTARRLKFFLKIARRWAPCIFRRSEGGLMALWFRITAIHLEAVRSFIRAGAYVPALITCLRFPLSLLLISVDGMASQEAPDRDFLKSAETAQDA